MYVDGVEAADRYDLVGEVVSLRGAAWARGASALVGVVLLIEDRTGVSTVTEREGAGWFTVCAEEVRVPLVWVLAGITAEVRVPLA